MSALAQRNELLADYRGYAFLPRLLPQRTCDELIAAACLYNTTIPHSYAEPFPCVPMVHRHIPEFLALMKHPSIVAEVRRELGGCDGLGSEFFFMPPGMRGMEQHQDNWFLRADSALSVWIALQDVDRQNGAMYVYPSSHERGLLEHNVEGARSRTLEFDGVRDVLAMKAGDALLIHPLTVHGSCDNASNRFRMSVVMTYIADGSDFRPGPKQNRTRVAL